MTTLTRQYRFSASHRLHSDRLTEEQNERVFGKCNHPFGHGHNYRLHVTVSGETDPRTGMVLPRAALDDYVRRTVLERLDHRNLNAEVAEFATLVPTTENLGLEIGRWLEEGWKELGDARLSRICLEETGANAIEIEFHEPQRH